MTEQAPKIDLSKGGGRLVYDKARRTIVAERREELDGEVVGCLEKMMAQNGVAWAYAQVARRAAEEIKALRETVRIAAVGIGEIEAHSITDAEIKRVVCERIKIHEGL